MHIVMVNGWSAHASLWDEFFTKCPSSWQIDVIDISRPLSSAEWLVEIDKIVSDNAVLCGWSLGGVLAVSYAHHTNRPLSALCLFQTNPCFVERTDWPCAMPVQLFSDFCALVERSELSTTKRQFAHMMVKDSALAREDLRDLKQRYLQRKEPNSSALRAGLALLESVDVRSQLTELELPILQVLGDKDSLVPVALANKYESVVIEGMGHLPCLAYREAVFQVFERFLNQHV